MHKLRVADHDHTVQTLFIRAGKGDKDRYVLLDPVTNRLLKAWVWNHSPERHIFPIGPGAIAEVVNRWAGKVGLTQKYADLGLRFSTHSIRHGMATHCYAGNAAGRSPGHDSAGTTKLYIHGDITCGAHGIGKP